MDVRNVSYRVKQRSMTLSEISEIVRKARAEKGWSRQELADAAGVSKKTVDRLEWGSGEVGVVAQTKIALALGFSQDKPGWFITVPIQDKPPTENDS